MCEYCNYREDRDASLYLEWAKSYLNEQGVLVSDEENLDVTFEWVWEGCCELCRSEVEEMTIIYNGNLYYAFGWPDLG